MGCCNKVFERWQLNRVAVLMSSTAMRGVFEFPELEGRLEFESEKYKPSDQNWYLAHTVLATATNLRELYDFVSKHAGGHTDDGKMFQHLQLRQSANALESLYWLTKHHQYNASLGRIRVLLEAYQALRGLNADQEAAAEAWDEARDEARHSFPNEELAPLERQSGALHDFRKEGWRLIKEGLRSSEPYRDLYTMLSNRGAHPASNRSLLVDGRYSASQEESQFTMGLAFAFGIVAQYIRTFVDTPMRWPIQKRADQIIVDIWLAIEPNTLPTLFRDDLYFWNPLRGKPPMVN